jgi:hypothetical protein
MSSLKQKKDEHKITQQGEELRIYEYMYTKKDTTLFRDATTVC